ncbi:MAG: hypothetical protein ACOYMA_20775 [Bacteroidia bacterium]
MRRTINSWIKYPLIVFNQLIDNGVELKNGYDMLFWGNMPIGVTLTPTEGLELITTFAMKDQLGNSYNDINSFPNLQINNHKNFIS